MKDTMRAALLPRPTTGPRSGTEARVLGEGHAALGAGEGHASVWEVAVQLHGGGVGAASCNKRQALAEEHTECVIPTGKSNLRCTFRFAR